VGQFLVLREPADEGEDLRNVGSGGGADGGGHVDSGTEGGGRTDGFVESLRREVETKETQRNTAEPDFAGEARNFHAGCTCLCRQNGDILAASSMRLITTKRLREYAAHHATIAPTLRHWTTLMLSIDFDDFVALRRVFPAADQVVVESGGLVTIFNIKNHYRLVTAIHYNRHTVFILMLLTHSDYDAGHWKDNL
jgi:mRNA interferase HigB